MEKGFLSIEPEDLYIDIGIQLHVRAWHPAAIGDAAQKTPFLLIHGLSSNAKTWDKVAEQLVIAGHKVYAVDQRGHGLSDKPQHGYDFHTMTQDLYHLALELNLDKPTLVGQSWGGNVVLEFGAKYPNFARQFVCVDGGFINLAARGSWEDVAKELEPPNLLGTPRDQLKKYIEAAHPNWDDWAIDVTLCNFQTLPDGTVKRWLDPSNHLVILRALYNQKIGLLYSRVQEKVLLCAAESSKEGDLRKRGQVEFALSSLKSAKVVWFEDAAHDIHVDRPLQLTEIILEFISDHVDNTDF